MKSVVALALNSNKEQYITIYTKDILLNIINNSSNTNDILRQVGNKHPTLVSHILKRCDKFDIDTSHIKRQLRNYGENKTLSGFRNEAKRIKIKLMNRHNYVRECAICKLSVWNGLPIPLEIDHINGNPKDNELTNLRIICHNCHAQTPTFRTRNIGRNPI